MKGPAIMDNIESEIPLAQPPTYGYNTTNNSSAPNGNIVDLTLSNQVQ